MEESENPSSIGSIYEESKSFTSDYQSESKAAKPKSGEELSEKLVFPRNMSLEKCLQGRVET